MQDLPKKEKAVLALTAQGMNYKEIGKELHMSPNTVQNHWAKSRERLNAKNTVHAVAIALTRGLINFCLCLLILSQATNTNTTMARRRTPRPPTVSRLSGGRKSDLFLLAELRP